jgi:hypothetical protein
MGGKPATSVCVPVDGHAGAELLSYRDRSPLLAIRTGRPALLVTLTVPGQIEAGHVEFARQLAKSAAAYAVEVERRFRGLSRLADTTKEVA